MVKIKSFSVGNGDMFYIDHFSDNFTLIDCNLGHLDIYRKMDVLDELARIGSTKGITRFISTHADQDHISGLKEIDERINILNFYTVKNEATKADSTEDFRHYCTLRDSDKAFYLHKGCSRKWMNLTDNTRYGAGLHCQWPILDNDYFKTELENAKNGDTPNNTSPIITYTLKNGATVAWMGDLETEMMDNIVLEIELPKVNVLFAPHHGRTSGIVPDLWLDQMNPELIIIGEGPPEHLADYAGWNTITQNDTGHINLYLETSMVDIFVENPEYSASFLTDNFLDNDEDSEHYIGSIEINS